MATPNPNRSKLFVASCMSLVSTSIGFAVMGGIMAPLKSQFILSNAQIGAISGIDGLIILAYISGIMILLRFFAGGLIHKLSPTGGIGSTSSR